MDAAIATVASVAVLGPMSARAQEPGQRSLEEVIVTAQKRAERLQDVPITIAAFSAAVLEQSVVDSPQDLQAIVPGFIAQQRVGSAAPYIRGVGSVDPSASSESIISTYIDGVYIPFMGAGTFSFNNIERIEVLKGPQGTLFGRNSVGGLINVITRNPSQELGGKVEFGYGNYGTISGKTYITGGLSDSVAADLAVAYSRQGDGWGRNIDTGAAIGFAENLGVRNKWHLDLGRTRATVALDYNRNEDDFSTTFSPYFIEESLTVPFAPISTRGADFYDRAGLGSNFSRVEQGGASLHLEHELPSVNVLSVTSYRRTRQDAAFDQDMVAATLVNLEQIVKSHDFSQELQVASRGEDGPSWIVGLYYLNHDAFADPLDLTLPIGVQQFNGGQTTDSLAGYAQLATEVLADTNLTVGLRYTHDRQSYSVVPQHPIAVAPPPRISGAETFPETTWRLALDHRFAQNVLGYVSYNRGFKSGQWNVTIATPATTDPEVLDAYELGVKSDLFGQTLRVNAAAFYYDYKNMQYNRIVGGTVLIANAADSAIQGLDIDLQLAATPNLELSLGAVYLSKHEYTSFPDGQFFAPNPRYPLGPPCGAPFFGVTPLCQASGNLTGNTVIQSPDISLNGSINYETALPIGELQFNVTGNYVSKVYRTVNGSVAEPGHELVNARVSLALSGMPLTVTAWVKNLTAQEYHAFGAALAFGFVGGPAAPRTYGLTLGYEF